MITSTANAVTTSTASTAIITAEIVMSAHPQIARIIRRVLRKAATWKRQCSCNKTGKGNGQFCESYGCSSLDELLKPLKEIRFIERKGKA